MEVVSEMSFWTISNANLRFNTKKFIWMSYTVTEALLITSRMELIDKHKFAKPILKKI